MVARVKRHVSAGDLQGRVSLEQDNPFVLRLVVDAVIRPVAADDALDDDVPAAQQLKEVFAALRGKEIGEKVAVLGLHVVRCLPSPAALLSAGEGEAERLRRMFPVTIPRVAPSALQIPLPYRIGVDDMWETGPAAATYISLRPSSGLGAAPSLKLCFHRTGAGSREGPRKQSFGRDCTAAELRYEGGR
jgi:hypothetical protein